MAWRMETDMKNAALITLPTPAGTPYRTPSRRSRKSRRAITPRDISPATPLPTDMMDKKNKRISGDLISDGNVGFLDPRRFTPTLHASLVSEILNLRRDQEEKLKLIDVLETSLQTAYEEKEGVQSTLSDTTKECRTLKRQLSLLEGGTTSAIGDLMRERDESVDANAETKKRLEAAQQKIRIQEEDSQRVHEMWSKEKDGWAEERRKFERQIHIAESRLKMVIEEVAQLQSAQANGGHAMERDAEETDITSPRTQSITSSIRFSTISGPGMGKAFTNLADELNFDDDDDQTDVDTRQSVLWSPVHRRNMSGGSISSKTYQRNYSIDSQARLGSFTGGRLQMIPSVLRKLEGNIEEDDETQPPPRRIEYVDAAVQGDADFQPPPNKFEYADAAVQGDQEILSPAKKVEYVDVAVQKNEEPKPPVKKIEYIDTAVQGEEEIKPLKKIEYMNSAAQWDLETLSPSKKVEYVDAAVQENEEVKPSKKIEYMNSAVQWEEESKLPPKKIEYVDAAVQEEEPKPALKKIEYVDTAVQGDEEVKPLKKIEYVHSGAQWAEKIQPSMNKSEYADAASQYTPPPSPRVVLPKFSTPDHHVRADGSYDTESSPRVEMEIEANQSRKRVHVNRLGPLDSLKLVTHSMESSASQTAEPTSPRVLRSPTERPAFVIKTKTMETTSIATQTDEPPARKKAAPLTIPSISIVPPSSAPPTPREHVLPQYVKDVGCQVSLLTTSCTISRSVAVQTDEIRVDTRLNKLPRHLHPSSITSRPTSSASFGDIEEQAVPEILPPRNPKRLTSGSNIIGAINEPTLSLHSLSIPSSPTSPPRQLCPGNKDNVSLFADKAPAPCNPRISTLFSTFDVISSDEGEESFGDGDLSDVEFRTALSAPNIKPGIVRQIQKAPASPGFTSPTSPKDTRPMLRESASVSRLPKGRESNDAFRPAEVRAVSSHKPIRMPSTGEASISRTNVIRRTAMIQSGISAHQGSSQSPIQSELQEPPFPIPTRASSRQGPVSASAPSESSRPPSRTPSGKHRHNSRSSIYRSNSVRKARSAAAIPRIPRNRKDNYSSSPVSPSELTLASQDLPPLPLNDITRPPRSRDVGSASYRTHKSRQSTNTANTDISSPISASGSPGTVGVVDAIAQTMVGEWMFKYVRRRRKSFGVDGGARDETGNDRHKRWVWLAPYEQAILWSSKQPASGSALMGKSGRKLTIKSVLDVKDDNPIPRGETQIFNRSILILTPQRALKFTASSAERHYLWIMALSFLAHSAQAVPQITSSLAPPKPAPAPDPELSKPKLTRGGIRDSIRLTKGRQPTLTARHERCMPPEEIEPVPTFPAHIESEIPVSIPTHQREPSDDPAQPPRIRRFNSRNQGRTQGRPNPGAHHARKRSNTGSHAPPPLSFRGFSPPEGSAQGSIRSPEEASFDTAGSHMYGQSQVSNNMAWGMNTADSQHTSDNSTRPSGNFFEAIGTVRMEAFINPLTSKFDDQPSEEDAWRRTARRQSKDRRRRQSRSRRRESLNSRSNRERQGTDAYKADVDEDCSRDDPFKGF